MPRRRRPPRPGALADAAPLRILAQIIILQAAYYVCAACLVLFTALVAGKGITLDLLLSWRTLRGDVTVGWMLGLIWMLNSLIWSVYLECGGTMPAARPADMAHSVVFLLLLVARSKLIPDYALTIHFLHLVVTSIYCKSVPTYWFWWGLQTASASLMTTLGVWSCRYRELQPISFGSRDRGRSAYQGDPATSAPQEDILSTSSISRVGVYELVENV